jgi:hypothetical protein
MLPKQKLQKQILKLSEEGCEEAESSVTLNEDVAVGWKLKPRVHIERVS